MSEADEVPMPPNGPEPGSVFRHFKGGIYEVVANAIHEETHEHLVIYKNADGIAWARPYSVWCENVQIDGRTVERFTLVSSGV